MKHILIILLAPVFSLIGQQCPALWDDGFEKKNEKEYFERKPAFASIVHGAGINGSKALVIDPVQAGPEKKMIRVFMKSIPVKTFTKYKFSFMAKVDGPDTFENNPQMEIIYYDTYRGAKGKPLPGWQLQFLDKNRKQIPRPSLLSSVMVHNDWTGYEEIFYAPLESLELQIIFHNFMNMDNKLTIDNLKLEIIDEGALNINPDFRYGIHNFSGYTRLVNTLIVEESEGVYVLDASQKGRFATSLIPVKPHTEYKLTANLRSLDKRASINARFHNIAGKEINMLKSRIDLNPPNREATGSMSFVVPENAAYVSLSGRDGIIKYLKLEEHKQ